MILRHRNTEYITLDGETRGPEGVSVATAEEGSTSSSISGQRKNDGGEPKPTSGSSSPHAPREERKGLHPRKECNIAKWNVRGFTTGELVVTVSEMRCGIHILGIPKH